MMNDKSGKSSIEKLRGIMPQLNELTATLKVALVDVRERKAKLDAERNELFLVPMRKEDYLALLHADIDARAESALQLAVRKLEQEQTPSGNQRGPFKYRGLFGIMTKARLGEIYLVPSILMLSTADPFNDNCFLHGDAYKAAITRAVDRLDWPYASSARPLQELKQAHDRLTSEIDALTAEETEIISQAAGLGIAVE